jgi:hypothetical protein
MRQGEGRRGAASAARPGGRCDRPVPARAARERLVNGRRALVDAREGGSSAGAAAMALAGVQASSREVVREGEGDGLVYRRPTSMLVTNGPTDAHLGAHAGLGRSAWQGERRTDPRSVGCSAAGARREEGADSEAF